MVDKYNIKSNLAKTRARNKAMRNQLKECVSRENYQEAIHIYTKHRFSIKIGRVDNYEKEFERIWNFLNPYFEIIGEIQIETFSESELADLKSQFFVTMIQSSPYNIKKKKFKSANEEVFYNHVYVDVMKHHNQETLEQIVARHISKLKDLENKMMKFIGVRTPQETSKDGPSCIQCKIMMGKQPYAIEYVPQLPLPECSKTRCYCFYYDASPVEDFVISIDDHPMNDKAVQITIGDETYDVWDPKETANSGHE